MHRMPLRLARRRPWLAGVGIIALLVLVALALLHAPPVRARVLVWLLSRADGAGLVARADRLDYNLLRREARIRGLTLATGATSTHPFLAVAELNVTLGWRALFGDLDIDRLEVVRPKIALFRDAAGVSNWPRSPSPSSTSVSPPSVRLGRLRVADLDVAWRDATTVSSVDAHRISIDLTTTGADAAGPLTMVDRALLRWRDHETAIESLGGHISWNSRDLSVGGLRVTAPEGTLRIDGRVETLLGTPRLDLRFTTDADLGRVAPWLNVRDRLGGAIHLNARIAGLTSAPEAVLTLEGRDLTATDWLPRATLDARARVAAGVVELTTVTIGIADGSLAGRGRVSLGEGSGFVRLDWHQLDLAVLLQPIVGRSPLLLPAARLNGSLDAQWPALDLDTLSLHGEGRTIASSASADDRSRPQRGGVPARLAFDGPIVVDLQRGRWRVRADQEIATAAHAIGDVGGMLHAHDLSQSTLMGALRVSAPDFAKLARTLARAGITRIPPSIDGAADGEFAVAGTLDSPRLTGMFDARDVRYAALRGIAVHTRVTATRHDVRLDEVQARVGENSVTGHLGLSIDSRRLNGQVAATLKNVATLSTALPAGIHPEGSLDITARVSGRIDAPSATAVVFSNALAVAGQQFDRLDADLGISGRMLAIDRLNLQSADGRLEARGRFDLADDTYRVHATADRVPIRPVLGAGGEVVAPIRARLTGEIDGEGSFADLAGRGRLALVEARWADVDIGRVEADLTAAGRTASIAIRAPDLALAASGDVGLEAGGRVSARARWEPNDVADLVRRAGWSSPLPIAGSAAIGLDVRGTRDRLQAVHVAADVERLDVDVDGQAVRLAHRSRLEYDEGRVLRIPDLAVVSGTSMLSIAGALGDPPSAALTASLRGSLADFAVVQRLGQPHTQAGSGAERLAPSGAIDLHLTATGSLVRPVLSGGLRITEGRLPLTASAAIVDLTAAARFDGGVLTLDTLSAAFQGATLSASGRLPLALFADRLPARWRELAPTTAEPMRVTAEVRSLTPRVLASFVDAATVGELQGRIDASVVLQSDRATLDRLNGTVTLTRAELSLSGVSFDQQTPTRLVLRDGRLAVAAWEWGRGDNRVMVAGEATLGADPSLAIDVTSTLDLRLLNAFTPTANASGRADSRIRVGGTADAPTLDGYVTFAAGELRVATPRLIVSDLTGTITMSRDSLTLAGLWAHVNGGEAQIDGSVRHRWFRPLDGQVTVRARDAAIDVFGLRAEADADLGFRLEPRGWVASGTVTLVRSAYREPLSLTTGLLRALQPSSTFTPSGAPSMLDDLRFDVRLTTQDDLLVDNNYARLGMRADIRLIGTVRQPALAGRATLAEGGVVYFGGNRYRLVEQGSIDFINPTRIEPDLNVRGVTRVRGYEITLALKGTPTTLQTSPTADDPRLSRADIVSLLVTGRTRGEAASGGFTPGSDELLGYLSGELFGAASRAVGLDLMRIERGTPDVRFDAGLVATETDPGARLTFGKNIGRDVEVVFSQSLRQHDGLTWIVSYAPQSRIELRTVSLDKGDRLYDFQHEIVFGAQMPAAARRAARKPPEVAEVRVVGAGADESALRSRLKLEPGDRFDFFRWQDDRDRLEAFYQSRDRLEARVTTRRLPAGASADATTTVQLVYDVRPGAHTTFIVDGFSLPDATIAAMKAAWTRAVVDEFLTEEVAAVARGELADRGFVLASVAAALDQPSPDEKRLRITIDRGPFARDRRVVFRGNQHVPDDRLRTLIQDRDMARAVWLDPDRVRDAVVAFYRREGYLRASVRIGPIQTASGTVARSIDVEEGEPFRVRELRVTGVRAFPPDELQKVSGLARGEPYSEAGIDRARSAIDQSYRTRGFNSAGVTIHAEAVADRPQVDVSVRVEEGPQQRLRDIVTTGAVRTRPALVSRALGLEVGEAVNLAEWLRARRRLYETGVFRRVDIESEPMARDAVPIAPDVSAEQPIRARVTVEEWPPLQLRYGLEVNDRPAESAAQRLVAPEPASGAGRSFGLGLAGDIGVRNLGGRAVSAGLTGRYTRDFRAARAYATAPSMFGLPITSNVFVSRSREQLGESGAIRRFVTDKTDVTLEQRVRPFDKTEVAYSYTFERNHTFDLNADPTDPFAFDVAVKVARLASTAIIDTRNDLVDATRGWFHASDLEYGPSSLGSDLHFMKYLLQQRYYRTIGPLVVATSARVGLATAFEQLLLPSERFFAGGGNSVRGYAEDVLGPHDSFGDAVGGKALVVLNEEVRFPIGKIVRGVGFLDAGRAFDGVTHIRLGDLSMGTGFGLRVQTPVALLRIDLGVPFDAAFGPRRVRWFFSIGQMF